MLVSAASVLLRRLPPSFSQGVDELDVKNITTRLAVSMYRPNLIVPNLLTDPHIVTADYMRMIMTDLALWTPGNKFGNAKVELAMRLVWQQAVCNAIAWQFDSSLCVYDISRKDRVPEVIDLYDSPRYTDGVRDILMPAAVKYTAKLKGPRVIIGLGFDSRSTRSYEDQFLIDQLEEYTKETLRDLRRLTLTCQLDSYARSIEW